MTRDVEKGLALLHKTCHAKGGMACAALGYYYISAKGIKRHYDSIGRYIGYTDLSTGRRYDSTGRYLGQ